MRKGKFQMKKMRFLIKILSMILTVSIVLELLPMSVWAVEHNEHQVVQNAELADIDSKAPIKSEVESERDMYKKVYERKDGTYTAYITSEPIHYYEDGKWQEIDNTLSEKNGVISNEANGYSVNIPSEINANKEITIENGDSSLSFAMADIESTSATINNEATTETEVPLDTKPSQVEFKDIQDNTDLKYDVTADEVKESIILSECPSDEPSYTYTLNADGGSLVLNSDNSIDLIKNNAPEMTIQKPYMIDNEEEYSENITVTLVENNDDTYTLTYTPDYTWLSDAEYPVAIDPTINIYSPRAISGAMIGTTSATATELETCFFVENSNTYNSEVYLYCPINFLSSSIKNYIITNAEMSVHCKATNNNDTIAAYGINASWDDATTSPVSTDTDCCDYNVVAQSNTFQRYVWNITEIAHKWSLGITDNNGIALKAFGDNNCKMQMYSPLGAPYTSWRPWFTFDYIMVNNATNSDMESFDMGRAGTLYLDKYAGSYYIKRTDLGISGNVMPAEVSYTYDPWGCLNGINNWFGSYWQIYDYAKIFYKGTETIDNVTRNKYALHDMGGDLVIFTEVVSSDEDYETVPDGYKASYLTDYVKYKSTFGADKILWVPKTDTDHANFSGLKIEDENYIYGFDSGRRICSVTNKSNNASSTFVFSSSSSAKLTNIIDGVGRKYVVASDFDNNHHYTAYSVTAKTAENNPIQIATLNGNVNVAVQYSYDEISEDYSDLITVTYADGEQVHYTYNSNHMLTSATNVDGTKWEITYTGNRIAKIKKLAGTQQTFAGQLEIDYTSAKLRTFKHYDPSSSSTPKSSEIVRYNANGEQISSVSNNGDYSYYEYEDPRDDSSELLSFAANDKTAENLLTNGNFESSDTNWTFTPSNAGMVDQTVTINSGIFNCMTNAHCKLYADIDNTQRIYQTISIQKDKVYTVSAWAYIPSNVTASNNLTTYNSVDRQTALCVMDANGNILAQYNYETTNTMNSLQFGAVSFKVDEALTGAKVVLVNDYQISDVYFDDVSLFVSSTGYVYEEDDGSNDPDLPTDPAEELPETIVDGNIIYRTKHCDNCNCAQCNEIHKVTYLGNPINAYYNCSCDDEPDTCNCFGCRQKQGTIDTKDSYGNIVSHIVTDEINEMKTTYSYSSDGNYLATVIDSDGVTEYYNYNINSGLLTSYQESWDSNPINYTYNAVGALVQVNQAVSNLTNGNAMNANYTYSHDRIISISHNGTTYNYEYDEFGNQTAVKVGTQSLVSYGYKSDKQTVNSITYGNGFVINYTFDSEGNITKIKYNNTEMYGYEYTDGVLTAAYNYMGNVKTAFTDDNTTIYPFTGSGENIVLGEAIYSSSVNNKNETVETVFGTQYTLSDISETYDATADKATSTSSVSYGNNVVAEVKNTTDFWGRITGKTYTLYKNKVAGTPIDYNYSYFDIEEGHRVGETISGINFTFGNSYDEYNYLYTTSRSIKRIYGHEEVENYRYYRYDEANQLIAAYNVHDNTAESYTYDANGNIRTKTLYSNAQVDDLEHATVVDTINYTYGDSSWSDKLTAYDGQTITYDAIGNPTSYKGAALTWQGRLLMSYAKDSERYDYTYDADGLRTSKKKYVNNVLSFTESYIWTNNKVVAVKRVNSDNTSTTVRYLYDANDELFGFVYNNKTYFYIKNPRGDIGGIINADDEIAYYAMDYDAWGNVTYTLAEGLTSVQEADALHIQEINNFTYRGYFYDSETNLYYLQSRYYDPEVGRFINADDTNYIAYNNTTASINIFSYCNNNPINGIDYNGHAYFGALAYALAVNYYVAYKSSLCAQLFAYGFNKNSGAFSKSFNELLTYRLRHSTAIQTYLNKIINHAQRRSKNKYNETFEINFYNYKKNASDVDLFLSVGGGCRINFNIEYLNKKNSKGNKIYKVTLKMSDDSFDFNEYWNKETRHDKNAVITVLNNIGYHTQKKGVFKNFCWSFKSWFEGSFVSLS